MSYLDCEGYSSPCCTVDSGDPENPNADRFFPYCPQPSQQVPKGVEISVPTSTVKEASGNAQVRNPINGNIVYTAGNTYTIFSDLLYQSTYEFSTCARTFGSYINDFDSYLVLRDPFGNVLEANYHCDSEADTTCSYISYYHDYLNFNRVYLSVYAVTNVYTCDYQYENPYSPSFANDRKVRKTYLYYGWIYNRADNSDNPSCSEFDESITCSSTVAEIPYGDRLSTSNLGFSADLCDAYSDQLIYFSINGGEQIPLYDDSDGYDGYDNLQDYEYSCDNIGKNNVTFFFFQQNCTTNFTLYDPDFEDGYVGCAAVYDGYNYDYALFLRDPLQVCQYGIPCAVNYQTTAPPIYFSGSCNANNNITFTYTSYLSSASHYVFDDDEDGYGTIINQGSQAYFGDVIKYEIYGYDTYGGEFTIDCYSQVNGGQWEEVYLETIDFFTILENGDEIYYDLYYYSYIFFRFFSPVTEDYYFYLYFCDAGISPSYALESGDYYEIHTDNYHLTEYDDDGTYELEFIILSEKFGPLGSIDIQLFFEIEVTSEGEEPFPLQPNPIYPSIHPHTNKRTVPAPTGTITGIGEEFDFYSVGNPIFTLTELPPKYNKEFQQDIEP